MYYCMYWQKSWVLTSARLWHWLWVRGLWRSCCLPGTPGRSMGAWQRRRPRWWGGSDGTDAGCQPTRGCSASTWLQPVTLPPTSSTTLKNNSKSSPSGRGCHFILKKEVTKTWSRDVIKTWTSWMCWKTIGHIFPGLFTFIYYVESLRIERNIYVSLFPKHEKIFHGSFFRTTIKKMDKTKSEFRWNR